MTGIISKRMDISFGWIESDTVAGFVWHYQNRSFPCVWHFLEDSGYLSDCNWSGEWIEAPGYEVIDTLLEKIPEVNLVAEDWRSQTRSVELKEHYHFKGMKILVFSIDTSENMRKIFSWCGKIWSSIRNTWQWYINGMVWCIVCCSKTKSASFLAREGIRQGSVKDRLLAYTWKSKAEYAIVPMADILGRERGPSKYTWQWLGVRTGVENARYATNGNKFEKYSRQMRQR